jgi:hypothetical protein
MRIVHVCLAFGLISSNASAQVGPSTLQMSCAQASALVASNGALVLSTGARTYDRFVRDANFCIRPETTEVAWVPTADVRQCPLNVCRRTDRRLNR